MSTQHREAMHIRLAQPSKKDLETKGKEELLKKMKLFHFILHGFDSDWPYASSYNFPYHKGRICVECGGVAYRNPMNSPSQIKALARQLQVPVKIERFALEKRCAKDGQQPVFQSAV